MLLYGIFPAITTPYYADGQVYFKKLEHNVDRYCRSPLSGLVVLGSTGEAILLSDQERREVLKSARQAAAPDKLLIAGTGVESALETLRLTEYAAEIGYDVALVRTPHYYKDQMNHPANMLAFYRFVADRSPLPVLIYNFPQATGYDIPAELVVELAAHPNVIGIKDSSGSIEKVQRIAEGTRHIRRTATATETQAAVTGRMLTLRSHNCPPLADVGESESPSCEPGADAGRSSSSLAVPVATRTRSKEVGFQVLVGSAEKFLPSLHAGAVGAIVAFADPAPTAMYEIYAAWKDRDQKLASEKQQRVAAAAKRVAGELGIPGVKYACDLNGYYGGPVRLPLLPLTAEEKAEIEIRMSDIRN